MALATVTLLAAWCLQRRGRAAASPRCCWAAESPSRDFFNHSSPKLQLCSDGTLKYMEVTLRPSDAQSQCYSTCFSPDSDRSDFTFLRPCPPPGTLPREPGAFLSAAGTLRDAGQVSAGGRRGRAGAARCRPPAPPPRGAEGRGGSPLSSRPDVGSSGWGCGGRGLREPTVARGSAAGSRRAATIERRDWCRCCCPEKESGDWMSGAEHGANGGAAAPRPPRRAAAAPNNEWER